MQLSIDLPCVCVAFFQFTANDCKSVVIIHDLRFFIRLNAKCGFELGENLLYTIHYVIDRPFDI